MEVEADESFKKAGAIPFKWEIRPGVPKIQHSQHQAISPSSDHHRPLTKQADKDHIPPIQETPRKLRPPPAAGFSFQQPNAEPRTRSFRSAPRIRGAWHRFDVQNLLTRPMGVVASDGCFLSPLLASATEKNMKKKKKNHKTGPEHDYMSDLETVSRWSVSSRKSASPFRDSLSSSFSSHESSPRRPVNDADWVGFALF